MSALGETRSETLGVSLSATRSLDLAVLTFPILLVFGISMGDRFREQSSQRWFVPLCVWLGAWFFAKVAINERIRDEREGD
jgi:hypothetical protein